MAGKSKSLDREAVKADLIRSYNDFVSENGEFDVITKERHRVILSPRATIVKDGFSFNLRATTMFDTPFVEEQDSTGLDGVRVNAVEIEESLHINSNNRCIGMFLFLHNQRDNLFAVVDKAKELRAKTAERQDRAKAMSKYIEIQDNESKQFSIYSIITGKNPYMVERDVVLNSLQGFVVNSPLEFLEACKDNTDMYRNVYHKALKDGYLRISGREILLDNKKILDITENKTAVDSFVEYATSKAGAVTYEYISGKVYPKTE